MDGTGTLLQPGFASELSITFVASLGGKKRKTGQNIKNCRLLRTATETDPETSRGDCRFPGRTLIIENLKVPYFEDKRYIF